MSQFKQFIDRGKSVVKIEQIAALTLIHNINQNFADACQLLLDL